MSPRTFEERLAALDALAERARRPRRRRRRGDRPRRTGAAERRRRSVEHTVVGLFGATGSGKSSLLNALVGAPVAATDVRRPTTTAPLAVLWRPEGASSLLDWLGIEERVVREAPVDPRAGSLILLDLPDVDSVAREHRDIAERLAGQVDAMVWVLDPQKYADAVLHTEFIRPHAAHGAVTLVVLNQADLLAPGQADEVLRHARALVAADGLRPAATLATSARTGAGVDALARAIGDIAAARTAALDRIGADLDALGATVRLRALRSGRGHFWPPPRRQRRGPSRPSASDRRCLRRSRRRAARRRSPYSGWTASRTPSAPPAGGGPPRRLAPLSGSTGPRRPLRRLGLGRAGRRRPSCGARPALRGRRGGRGARSPCEPRSRRPRRAWPSRGARSPARPGEAAIRRSTTRWTAPSPPRRCRPAAVVVADPAIAQWLALATALVGIGWLLLAASARRCRSRGSRCRRSRAGRCRRCSSPGRAARHPRRPRQRGDRRCRRRGTPPPRAARDRRLRARGPTSTSSHGLHVRPEAAPSTRALWPPLR